MQRLLDQAANEWSQLLSTIQRLAPQLQQSGELLCDLWQNKHGKLLLAGNGGSAADALHLAEELTVRYQKNRQALAAIALCEATALTCAGNDFGFDAVFARQVEALGRPGDVLCVFSTSGHSKSILRALETAREKHLKTIGFLGRDGGAAKALCDIELTVPSTSTARIQEAHQLLYHVLCEWIDEEFD